MAYLRRFTGMRIDWVLAIIDSLLVVLVSPPLPAGGASVVALILYHIHVIRRCLSTGPAQHFALVSASAADLARPFPAAAHVLLAAVAGSASCAPFAVDDVVWGPGVAALAAGLLGVLEVVAVAAQVGLAPVLDAAAWAGGEARVVEARRGCAGGEDAHLPLRISASTSPASVSRSTFKQSRQIPASDSSQSGHWS